MGNRFYTAFDVDTFGGDRRTDYRSAFQIDRDRIIHAQAFRKLQSKTQVFLSGEYDFDPFDRGRADRTVDLPLSAGARRPVEFGFLYRW